MRQRDILPPSCCISHAHEISREGEKAWTRLRLQMESPRSIGVGTGCPIDNVKLGFNSNGSLLEQELEETSGFPWQKAPWNIKCFYIEVIRHWPVLFHFRKSRITKGGPFVASKSTSFQVTKCMAPLCSLEISRHFRNKSWWPLFQKRWSLAISPRKTNKNSPWKWMFGILASFLLGFGLFSVEYVSFRECITTAAFLLGRFFWATDRC